MGDHTCTASSRKPAENVCTIPHALSYTIKPHSCPPLKDTYICGAGNHSNYCNRLLPTHVISPWEAGMEHFLQVKKSLQLQQSHTCHASRNVSSSTENVSFHEIDSPSVDSCISSLDTEALDSIDEIIETYLNKTDIVSEFKADKEVKNYSEATISPDSESSKSVSMDTGTKNNNQARKNEEVVAKSDQLLVPCITPIRDQQSTAKVTSSVSYEHANTYRTSWQEMANATSQITAPFPLWYHYINYPSSSGCNSQTTTIQKERKPLNVANRLIPSDFSAFTPIVQAYSASKGEKTFPGDTTAPATYQQQQEGYLPKKRKRSPTKISDHELSIKRKPPVVGNDLHHSKVSATNGMPNKLHKTDGPPPFRVICADAIMSSPTGKMVLAEIYEFVLNKYPCFNAGQTAWRNSIRHSLSVNSCFVKRERSPSGKGYYWAIRDSVLDEFKKGNLENVMFKKKGYIKDNSCSSVNTVNYTAANSCQANAVHTASVPSLAQNVWPPAFYDYSSQQQKNIPSWHFPYATQCGAVYAANRMPGIPNLTTQTYNAKADMPDEKDKNIVNTHNFVV